MVIYKSKIEGVDNQFMGNDRLRLCITFRLENEKQTLALSTVCTPRLMRYLKLPENPEFMGTIRERLVGKQIGIEIK